MQISLFRRGLLSSTIQLPVHLHSLSCVLYDPLTSLPCGIFKSYFPMGHTEAHFMSYLQFLPASACRSASAHMPISRTVVRTEYVVMSFPSTHFSHIRLSLLTSMVACVYMRGMRFLRCFGFDWNYYYFIISHSSFSSSGCARVSVWSIYCINCFNF